MNRLKPIIIAGVATALVMAMLFVVPVVAKGKPPGPPGKPKTTVTICHIRPGVQNFGSQFWLRAQSTDDYGVRERRICSFGSW